MLQDLADKAEARQALQELLDVLVAARDAFEELTVYRPVGIRRVGRGCHARVKLAPVVGKQLAGAQVDDPARRVELPRLGVEPSAMTSTRASDCAISIMALSAWSWPLAERAR